MTSVMQLEMAEQPLVASAVIAKSAYYADRIAALLGGRRPVGVVIIARGSSLNAGTYLAYAIETMAEIPVSLARPSVFTRYEARPNFEGWLAIALSQSGQTPEIVSASQAIVECGAALITVTNDVTSPLAALGHVHMDLAATQEQAVPATKTVTAQMICALIISSALPNGDSLDLIRELETLPSAIEWILVNNETATALGRKWAKHPGLTVLGRGFGFAAAHEIALKVREVAGVFGEAWSATAFKHGPIAGLTSNVPVLITSMTANLDIDSSDIARALAARGNPLAICSPDPQADLPLPPLTSHGELLSPILAVIRGQQLCAAMALAIGRNPDAPTGLNKVTFTK
jgi:glutamine---fructose-6-phosphate transaminase (isomerizing)